ncbi:LCP family protein [uncultured Corynebacterium sp.]|uniref:LCP family protein n=1 Tax=uncultured Corynebacterium sp. TaxID=159447 RepID=UPI0025DB9ED8|nr:LCP family protein [uncultured Corynebacterium sp.]
MTFNGHDPQREQRRAGGEASSTRPSGSGALEDYVLGADGTPLLDRYGRPVRRRQAAKPADQRRAGHDGRAERATRAGQAASQGQGPATFPRVGQAGAGVPGYGAASAARQPSRASQQRPVQSPLGTYQVPPRRDGGASAPAAAMSVPAASAATRAPAAQRPHRRAKKANPVKVIGGWLGAIIAAILVLTLAFGLWTDSRLARIDALDYQQVANTAGTNWLLVGSDSRAGMTEAEQQELGTGGDVGGTRTDTIMLLHIPTSGTAKLVSIPRDSYVDIPGFGMDKINAAFTYGGAPLLGQTIEQWSGLRIDRYAEIGMGGLANVVNSVGGVDICVAEPINDPLAGIDLQAGCQNLQGRDALGYVRTRTTAMGDLDRVQRQREFFAALLDKITSPATLINPFRVVSLVNHTAQSFVVGQDDHVWNLARVALAMGSGVETETVPVSGFADTAVGNVVLWDDAGTAALWESLK